MGSKIFQENVVACVVDEAHCVELWQVRKILFNAWSSITIVLSWKTRVY